MARHDAGASVTSAQVFTLWRLWYNVRVLVIQSKSLRHQRNWQFLSALWDPCAYSRNRSGRRWTTSVGACAWGLLAGRQSFRKRVGAKACARMCWFALESHTPPTTTYLQATRCMTGTFETMVLYLESRPTAMEQKASRRVALQIYEFLKGCSHLSTYCAGRTRRQRDGRLEVSIWLRNWYNTYLHTFGGHGHAISTPRPSAGIWILHLR